MIRYIKVPLAEADELRTITPDMLIEGLDIDITKELTDYLIWEVIEDFSYVTMAIFDLVNKNRMYPSSEAEIEFWENIVAANPTWEIVTERPPQEEDVEI